MAITDLRDEVMDEIPSLLDEGITSLKLFMAYKNVYQVDDTTLFRAMETASKHGMIVMVHAENGDVEAQLRQQLLAEGKTDPVWHYSSRPPEIEGEATNRAVVMAGLADCRAVRRAYDLRAVYRRAAARPGARLPGHGRKLRAVLPYHPRPPSGRARL